MSVTRRKEFLPQCLIIYYYAFWFELLFIYDNSFCVYCFIIATTTFTGKFIVYIRGRPLMIWGAEEIKKKNPGGPSPGINKSQIVWLMGLIYELFLRPPANIPIFWF